MLSLFIGFLNALPNGETQADLDALVSINNYLSEFAQQISKITVIDISKMDKLKFTTENLEKYTKCMNKTKEYTDQLANLEKGLEDEKSQEDIEPFLAKANFFGYDTEAFLTNLVDLFGFFAEEPDLAENFKKSFTMCLKELRKRSAPVEGDTKTTTNFFLRLFGMGKNKKLTEEKDLKKFRDQLSYLSKHYRQIMDHLSKIIYSDGLIERVSGAEKAASKLSQEFTTELKTFESQKESARLDNPKRNVG